MVILFNALCTRLVIVYILIWNIMLVFYCTRHFFVLLFYKMAPIYGDRMFGVVF